MSEEYQRIVNLAREIDAEIAELERHRLVNSAMKLAVLERKLAALRATRCSLSQAMIFSRSVASANVQEQQREFIRQLPQKYHAHTTRD